MKIVLQFSRLSMNILIEFFFINFCKYLLFYSVDESTISNDNVGVVLEEAEIIDCDTEIETVAEEDNIQYQLCEVNRNDNAVAYRVVQVGDGHTNNAELSIATPINNTVQVLTSPINGQFYVLSNGNEVVASESTRTASPRVKLQIDNPQNILTTIKKVTFSLPVR